MICKRCGYEDPTTGMLKKVERGGEQLCNSCTAKPVNRVRSAYGICRPWKGELDKDLNPIDLMGRLVRAGYRKCGNLDCVARSHIIDPRDVDLERLAEVYRDGKSRTPKQIRAKVMKEGRKNAGNNHTATGDN